MLRGGARPEKVNWGLPDSVWAGVWPRVECAVCVMHLGLRRGSGRFCWGSPRRGAALARRRAGLYGLGCTTATLAGLKGRWGRGGPHRGLKQAGDDAQHGVVGEVGGGRGRSSRMNRRRESPGLRERRGGPRGHCKEVEGFRAAGAPVAARNFGSGGVHLRRMLGEIPALAWLNSWDRKFGEILGAEA